MASFPQPSPFASWPRLRPFLVAAVAVGVLALLAHWGGTASPGPLFVLGVVILIAIIGGMAALGWWLLLSPLPAKQRVAPRPASATVRQLLAVLIGISGLLFALGGTWDEVWHRRYGVALLGEDFWWRPHQLIYACLALNALFAFGGLLTIMRGRGTLRQRFRAEPLVGLLTLACGTLILLAPSDPLWHSLYGLDITAWSIPHLTLGIGLTTALLSAVTLQLSLIPAGRWRTLVGIGGRELLALFTLAMLLLIHIQFGTAEWEGIRVIGANSVDGFWQRPEWLYPAILVALAAFAGMIGLHSLRRVGAATVIGLIVVGARLVILRLFDAGAADVNISAQSHLLLLAPLVALDLVCLIRLRAAETEPTRLLAGLAAVAAVCLIDLPLINAYMVYPRIDAETLLPMIAFTLLVGLGVSWAGARLGDAIAGQSRPVEQAEASPIADSRIALVGVGALVVALLAVAAFILTSAPPLPL